MSLTKFESVFLICVIGAQQSSEVFDFGFVSNETVGGGIFKSLLEKKIIKSLPKYYVGDVIKYCDVFSVLTHKGKEIGEALYLANEL